MRIILGALAVAGLLAAPGTASSQTTRYKIVVNAQNTVRALRASELSRIFLRHAAVWQNGQPVLPVDLSDGSSVRQAFVREVLGKDSAALNRYWQQQIFAGRAVPPPAKATEEEILDYVRRYPGAIGYVSAGMPLGPDMRVVAVLR